MTPESKTHAREILWEVVIFIENLCLLVQSLKQFRVWEGGASTQLLMRKSICS
jgi:hypothetical protein